MATIIDPSKDTAPANIFIPNLSEAPRPIDSPSDDDIQRWHDMTESKTVYKQKECDPKSFNAKVRFKPDHVFPEYEILKNKVKYKFRVIVLNGKDKDGLWITHNVDVSDDTPQGRPNDMAIPCKEFLNLFVAE